MPWGGRAFPIHSPAHYPTLSLSHLPAFPPAHLRPSAAENPLPCRSGCVRLKRMKRIFVFVWLGLFVAGAGSVAAQQPPAITPADPSLSPPPIKQISETVFEIGRVHLDKAQRSISFPASVNMTHGVIEYAIVGTAGKRHESVLTTEAQPHHIHLAMLLLGATNRTAQAESGQPIAGEAVDIWVSPQGAGAEPRVRIEHWIRKEQDGKAAVMETGFWIYNGSRVIDGTFIAQRDESIVSIIHDPDALMNNPRRGRENDEIWFVNDKAVARMGALLTVTVQIRAQKP